ncbi:DUF2238 domain-containing protein [Phytopseudomonas daroniae]|uniref:DUF2238 domain-containing protein n=1 Tax=Pseudomonadaceae TaxID=135621 RepID=UPI001F613EDA|nr:MULTISPECIES: DUF2238 domain-containing protein [Pseudomonas]
MIAIISRRPDNLTLPTATPAQASTLLALAVAAVICSGIAPHSRVDWLVENALPVGLLLGLAAVWRHLRLSCAAYLAILLMIGVHELGAHFTYAEVPYEKWIHDLTGHSLSSLMGWQRNQFDRLVHLSYGVLFFIPFREIIYRQTTLRGAWLALMAVSLILATSALYELIEWVGGQYLGDDQAEAFLATQEDPWDAQKDMALALLGALTSLMMIEGRLFFRVVHE